MADFKGSELGMLADSLHRLEVKLLRSNGDPIVLRECEEILLVGMLRSEQARLHNLWFVQNSL